MLRTTLLASCIALAPMALAGADAACESLEPGRQNVELKLEGTEIDLDGDVLVLNNGGAELVRIDRERNLTIAGRAIAVPAAARADLDAYVAGFRKLTEDAERIGEEGGRIAAKAVSGLASVMFTSATMDDFERDMEARGARIEAQAEGLCRTVAALQRVEQALQSRIPAFPNVISPAHPAL